MLEEIGEIAAALRSGALTSEALLERTLERIERQNRAINSFVAVDQAGARAAARESDVRLAQNTPRSLIEGIPLSIKDNMLVRGMPATWGSKAFADFIPERDEMPVARLREAGAVIVGKTNVPELTLEGYTKNDLFGVTRNPWDTHLTPGGSSGGAAASVAAGMVPAAIGTDGGGSIRRPASHTGLVGWKPSMGRFPRAWGFPSILTDFEVAGTLTRSVSDARILDAVMVGTDPRDRRSMAMATSPWLRSRPRVLYVSQFGNSPVDSEILRATSSFAEEISGIAEVIEGELFFDLETMNSIWRVISRAGVDYLTRLRPNLELVAGASVQDMAADGKTLTAADFLSALESVSKFRLDLSDVFEGYDLVLTPTAAALPWAAEEPFPKAIAGMPAGPRAHAVFTGWVNIGGLPGISLPAGFSQSGLPIGVQLVTGFGRDEQLLEFSESAMKFVAPSRPFPKL
jgi:aspartyl-tRNA(Asn)/glutamyl-tRNA(Gln) amidotransferase subunit A